jgi:polyisoprenoid-binding protein YceI
MRPTLRLFVIVALLLGALSSSLQAATKPAKDRNAKPAPQSLIDVRLFQVDGDHSSIQFAVQWMSLTKVRGTFTDIRGTIGFDDHDLTRSSISIAIPMSSLTTFHAQRDKDLQTKSFFDVATHPRAMFTSKAIEKTGDGYLMHGALTIRGVTRDVDVPFTFLGEVVDSGGTGHRLGFEGRLTIDRNDYGVVGTDEFNKLTQLGQRMIGDKVDLLLSIQGWMWTPTTISGTVDSLYREIVQKGMPAMVTNYRKLRAVTPDSLMAVDEGVMNTMGYHLLRNGRSQDALAMFQLELEAFVNSAFARVGMGQTYAELGERDRAIENCEKALALNPGATRATEILRRLRPVNGG